ncbi:MAG: thiopurine S-methyltransferase [Gammaproteobacteria bacterium]|nr:thiopurine S-methyltransferase [Gammaproteobacteria bacterium]
MDNINNRYWLKKWDKTEIGFNQSKPHFLLVTYFKVLKLMPGSRIFVPLCGKSIDMLWLLEQGYVVVGIELSTVACEAFFKEHQLSFQVDKASDFIIYSGQNITLLCGDYFKLTQSILGHVDATYDRAALIALTAEKRKAYVFQLFELIPLKSIIFLITLTYNPDEIEGPPFSVFEKEIISLYQNNRKIQKMYDGAVKKVSPHLQAKGLKSASEQVYYLN